MWHPSKQNLDLFDLNWIDGRFWPQHFELLDVTGIHNLKCPNIDVPKEWLKNTIL
jgi:hypothetical protein